jgi:hypothetical protein
MWEEGTEDEALFRVQVDKVLQSRLPKGGLANTQDRVLS